MARTRAISSRRKSGASIALAVAFFFVCVMLIYFGFNMSVLMGGSRQVRNAVDAAVLNVSKRAIETKVKTTDEYKDVADSSGGVGLSNINRIWGKALLVNANVVEMEKEGLVTGTASGNAVTAYQMAKQLNDKLVDELKDPVRLNMYFRHTSKKRGAALLGESATLDKAKDTNYEVAMVGRGDESNIRFKSDQLPNGLDVGGVKVGGKDYLQGYQSVMVNNRPFMFTTFHLGEMPHLVADSTFAQCKPSVTPLGDFPNPIPNAWQVSGIVAGDKGSMRASAAGVANPQRQFDLAIPHGYVSIQISNMSQWYIEGKFQKTIPYLSVPGQKITGFPNGKLSTGQKFQGFAIVGNEYNAPNLLGFVDMTGGDKEAMYDRITQRLKQVDPAFTKIVLKKLMDKVQLDVGETEYFIYPNYSTADHTDPKITISAGSSKPSWIKQSAAPEGKDKVLFKEKALIGYPNKCWAQEENPPPVLAANKLTGSINWVPGTGFNQCLGVVRMLRETRINFVPAGGNPLTGI